MNTAVETRNTSVAGDVAARAGGNPGFLFIGGLAKMVSSKGHASASSIRCYLMRVDPTRGRSRAAAVLGFLRRTADKDSRRTAARLLVRHPESFRTPPCVSGMVAGARQVGNLHGLRGRTAYHMPPRATVIASPFTPPAASLHRNAITCATSCGSSTRFSG